MLGCQEKQSAGFIGFTGPGGADLRFSRPRNSSRLADTVAQLVQSYFRAANDLPCLDRHQWTRTGAPEPSIWFWSGLNFVNSKNFPTDIELTLYSCHVTRRSRWYRRATLPTVIANFVNAWNGLVPSKNTRLHVKSSPEYRKRTTSFTSDQAQTIARMSTCSQHTFGAIDRSPKGWWTLITMRVITCLCIRRQELTKVRSNRFQTLFHLCNNSPSFWPNLPFGELSFVPSATTTTRRLFM